MQYLIVFAGILIFSFFSGLVMGMAAYDGDSEEQRLEDQDQMQYLKRWNEKRKRS